MFVNILKTETLPKLTFLFLFYRAIWQTFKLSFLFETKLNSYILNTTLEGLGRKYNEVG
jgi:hypothetical protein